MIWHHIIEQQPQDKVIICMHYLIQVFYSTLILSASIIYNIRNVHIHLIREISIFLRFNYVYKQNVFVTYS